MMNVNPSLGLDVLEQWLSVLGFTDGYYEKLSDIGKACDDGNVVSLVKILSNQKELVDSYVIPSCPITPLFVACRKNRSSIVDLLLYRYGASLCAKIDWEKLPNVFAPNCIHMVCVNGNVALLRKLLLHTVIDDATLNAGQSNLRKIVASSPIANFDPFENSFMHPFTLACLTSNLRVVSCLMEFYDTWSSTDIAELEFMGFNILHIACMTKSETMLKYVLRNDKFAVLIDSSFVSDSNSKTDYAISELWHKIFRQITDIKSLYPELKDIILGEAVVWTPLSICVLLNWPQGVQILLSKGANVFVQSNCTTYQTVLHLAVARGTSEVLSPLISAYKNSFEKELVERPYFANNTSLHIAVLEQQSTCVVSLLKEFPEWANVHDGSGNVPVHYACLHKNHSLFTDLLSSTKCPQSVTGENGYTALHFLCLPHSSSSKITKSDEEDSNVDSTCEKNTSNCEEDLFRILEKLLVHCPDLGMRDRVDGCTRLHLALEFQSHAVFDTLLISAHVQDLQVADFDGKTLLHYAALQDDLEAASKIILLGVDVNAKDMNNQSSLHLCKSVHMARLLTQNEAIIDLQEYQGYTPLHISVMNGDPELLDYFLDIAKLDVLDSSGRNILHMACKYTPNNLVLEVLSKVLLRIGKDTFDLNSQACEYDKQVTALNFAIRIENDILSLQLLKLLVDSGANRCDISSALYSTVQFNLLQTCMYLMKTFKADISPELVKQVAFLAIKQGRLEFVKFFFTAGNELTCVDICQIKLYYPYSTTALLYPIEMCIAAAVMRVHTRAEQYLRDDQEIGKLCEVYNFLYSFYTTSETKVYKFDFLTTLTMLAGSLKIAVKYQKLFHMVTQWMALNEVDPAPIVDRIGEMSAATRATASIGYLLHSTIPSSWLILAVYNCCQKCQSYWKYLNPDLWVSLVTFTNESNEISVRDVALIDFALLLALNMVQNTNGRFIQFVSSMKTRSFESLLNEERPATLRELSATCVRNSFFTPSEILKLKFDHKLPAFLAKIVGKNFSAFDKHEKILLSKQSDLLLSLQNHGCAT